MQIEFTSAIQNASQFPASVIKAQPGMSLKSCRLFFSENAPLESVITYNKARYALYAAARFLAVTDKKSCILLPAYHCPALVEPFMHAGYDIEFYPQQQDLHSNLGVFKQLLSDKVTHVLVVRFLGFSQNAEQLIELAHIAGKKVIEDNAHSMWHFLQTCISKRTDIAASVSSLSKTLGTADGGALYMPGFDEKRQKPGIQSEMKALISGQRYINTPVDNNAYRYFKPELQDEDCLRSSRWLMMNADYYAIRIKRRDNFKYLVKKLQESSVGRLLYTELRDNDVPYVLPFLLSDLKTFSVLRQEQLQVLRWEELAKPLSTENCLLREKLIQIPLHHQLSITDLNAISGLFI